MDTDIRSGRMMGAGAGAGAGTDAGMGTGSSTGRGARRVAAFLAAGVLMAGCATAPKERFYTLSVVRPQSQAQPQPAAEATPLATRAATSLGTPTGMSTGPSASAPVTVSLTALTLPDLYDRPQFVVREDANRVAIKEAHRWAQSLRLDIARVLGADIVARLPNATLVATDLRPAPASGPDYRIGVGIEAFDAFPGQAVVVQAGWSVRPVAGGAVLQGRSDVREAVDGLGYDALAAAYSRALAKVGAQIAARLANLPHPQSAAR